MFCPDVYTIVTDNKSGEMTIIILEDDDILDIQDIVKAWVAKEYSESGLTVNTVNFDVIGGDYTATIYTDSTPINGVRCWESVTFWIDFEEDYD